MLHEQFATADLFAGGRAQTLEVQVDYWQQLIAIILTPTLSVAALAWLLKSFFDSGLRARKTISWPFTP